LNTKNDCVKRNNIEQLQQSDRKLNIHPEYHYSPKPDHRKLHKVEINERAANAKNIISDTTAKM